MQIYYKLKKLKKGPPVHEIYYGAKEWVISSGIFANLKQRPISLSHDEEYPQFWGYFQFS